MRRAVRAGGTRLLLNNQVSTYALYSSLDLSSDSRRCRGLELLGEDFPKHLVEFIDRFASEGACREYLMDIRWPAGFVCPNCSGRKGWRTGRGTIFCSACRRQTSPTAGTILHNSRVPFEELVLGNVAGVHSENGAQRQEFAA